MYFKEQSLKGNQSYSKEKIKNKIGKEERNKASFILTGDWTRNSHKCHKGKFGFNTEDFFQQSEYINPEKKKCSSGIRDF